MMLALTIGLLVAVGLLIVRIRKITQDQESLWQRLNSISLTTGWIRVADDDGSQVNIRGGSLWLRGPHGYAGPQLTLRTVPGTADSYPYDHLDGSVSQEKAVDGGGFDIAFDTPTLPDMPLPPRIRLEFRDDTLTVRTWQAKVKTAEWQMGDGY
jgi:hypothetical protein